MPSDEEVLLEYGWKIECVSPFEIRMVDDEKSFASGEAALLILELVKRVYRTEKNVSYWDLPPTSDMGEILN